ncbi:MAG TPA: serine/threonine protein kinase [Tessaracoccus flavescens]|uniref:non-specific serine/threonine protein kinase n=1 Tax=Tessaracoccus flavescens TaxID=399497 RepID=A0A921JSL3_9ACTN|nr:serine/threonine protein kinase [Tessaracoccus flavescens]
MMRLMGQVFAGRYELVDLVGAGAHGSVWRVWDRRERRYVAGKVLSQADSVAIVRFIREQGLRFEHQHIVAPLGWVGEDDRVMFTMPLVRGGSLSTLLSDYGALPERWVLLIADQLLSALEVVHAAGVVHRDVKPHNILLSPGNQPHVWLSDFGTAVTVDEDVPRLTRLHHVVGTPGYLSPEAAVGADPDPLQDLYAAGVVLWQAVTGERPPRDGAPVVSAALAVTALGGFIVGLLAPAGSRTESAAEARRQLRRIPLPSEQPDEPIEVFDQVPALPDGWGTPDVTPSAFAARVDVPTVVGPAPEVGQSAPLAERSARRLWPLVLSGMVSAIGLLLLVAAAVVWFS